MHYDFEFMKAVALDPFARNRILRDGAAHDRGAAAADAGHAVDPSSIANGAWSEAECCCDPGPDEFPEAEALALNEGLH